MIEDREDRDVDEATARPWGAPTMRTPPVVRRVDQDEQGRRRTRFVAEFLECADGSLDAHANAILAVEAVNAYDRLRGIEAAARELTVRMPVDTRLAALRSALSEVPSDAR